MMYGPSQVYTFAAGSSTTEVVGTNQPSGIDLGGPYLITNTFKLGGVVQAGYLLALDDQCTSYMTTGYPYTNIYWPVSVTQVPLSVPPKVLCQDSVIQASSYTSSGGARGHDRRRVDGSLGHGQRGGSFAAQRRHGGVVGNTLEWTNQTTPVNSSNGSFGSGMTSDQLPQLGAGGPDTIVAVNGSVTDTFLYDNGSYLNEYLLAGHAHLQQREPRVHAGRFVGRLARVPRFHGHARPGNTGSLSASPTRGQLGYGAERQRGRTADRHPGLQHHRRRHHHRHL